MEVIFILNLIGALLMSLLIVPDLARRQGRKVTTWVVLVLFFGHWAYLLLYFLPKQNPSDEFYQPNPDAETDQPNLIEAVERVQKDADRVVYRFKEAAQGAARVDPVEPEMAKVDEASPLIEQLVETWADLISSGQDELADKVRDRLLEMGVVIEDGPEGTTWHHLK